jgi:hypothetical protein
LVNFIERLIAAIAQTACYWYIVYSYLFQVFDLGAFDNTLEKGLKVMNESYLAWLRNALSISKAP